MLETNTNDTEVSRARTVRVPAGRRRSRSRRTRPGRLKARSPTRPRAPSPAPTSWPGTSRPASRKRRRPPPTASTGCCCCRSASTASPSRAAEFATLVRAPIQVNVSQTVRLNAQLEVRSLAETVTVAGDAQLVDTSTNALGRVITGRELVDLPLNGRNFTQLGLLQTGVAPLTAGVTTAGGSLRQGQAYAVNGMRPEQNMYLVDGAQNMNRMDGGYALKLPVEAIAEFRILTQSAPPEYGGTGGATTSVVTRSGGNQFHGNLYEFLRNDMFDARNFFSAEVEPLKQHQFGATVGGPIARDTVLFFGYYEGFRNKQGTTTTATVPTAQERQGDFSGMSTPLLNLAAGGVPFPGNKIPEAAINPVARNVAGSLSARATCRRRSIVRRSSARTTSTRPAAASISTCRRTTRSSARYSYSGGHNINPISVRGTDVPGFPTRDDLSTHAATLSSTHIFSPSLTNSLRGTFLRHVFFFDQRLNRTPPSALGFGYASSNEVGQGPPFFNVSGYTPIGGAITGPRNTKQNTFEVQDGLTWTNGVPPGEGRRRAQAHRDRHGPGDRAECVLRLRGDVSDQQRRREPAARRAGDVLSGPWRLQPRRQRLDLARHLRAGRVARRPARDAELRASLRAHQPLHRGRGPPERLRAGHAVERQAGRAGRARVSGDPGIGRGIAQSANAFMPRVGRRLGSDRERARGPCGPATASSTTSSRTAPAPRRRWRSAPRRGRSSISSAAPASTSRIPIRDGRCRRRTRSSGPRRSSRSTPTRSRRRCRTGT